MSHPATDTARYAVTLLAESPETRALHRLSQQKRSEAVGALKLLAHLASEYHLNVAGLEAARRFCKALEAQADALLNLRNRAGLGETTETTKPA